MSGLQPSIFFVSLLTQAVGLGWYKARLWRWAKLSFLT